MSFLDSLIILKDGRQQFPEEIDDTGFIEYKLRLDKKEKHAKHHNKKKTGITSMISQMNWRMTEGKRLTGKKIAHYILGINDDGTFGELNETILDETFKVFMSVVDKCNASIISMEKKMYHDSCVIHATIHKLGKDKINEINIAIVGPSQHGKTTMISHIVHGKHDDGNGFARQFMFKYEHEKETGLTSSIKKEIIGFFKGKLINYGIGDSTTWEEITDMSEKIINLIDMPGNTKYIKTTLFGLSTYRIDSIFIVFDINKATGEDYRIMELYCTYAELKKINCVLVCIEFDAQLINYEQHPFLFNIQKIKIDNKSKEGMDDLLTIINKISNRIIEENNLVDDAIFYGLETYFNQDTGTIFSGILMEGLLELDKDVYLTNGKKYVPAIIKSIHKKQIDSRYMYKNETGAIQLEPKQKPSFEYNKHILVTTQIYPQINYLFFKIKKIINFGKRNFITEHPNLKNDDESLAKSMCSQSILFIGNHVLSVTPVICKFEHDVVIINFDQETTIFPFVISNNPVVAFVKNIYGLYIGYATKTLDLPFPFINDQ